MAHTDSEDLCTPKRLQNTCGDSYLCQSFPSAFMHLLDLFYILTLSGSRLTIGHIHARKRHVEGLYQGVQLDLMRQSSWIAIRHENMIEDFHHDSGMAMLIEFLALCDRQRLYKVASLKPEARAEPLCLSGRDDLLFHFWLCQNVVKF